MGNLTVDTESKFTPRGGDKEKGFKFDLTTGKRLNTFKTEKNSERELWRAYVVGLSKGHVPSDIDLLDTELRKIQREIDSYISGNPAPNDPSIIYRQSGLSKSSSDESGVVVSIGPQDGFSVGRVPSYSGSSSSGSRSASTFVENGGPTLIHKFYDDRSRDQTPPSWFFSHCSRQQAETILQRGERYGNTLIRESTSYKDNGSYVISKLVRKQGAMTFEHYEVMRTAGGYKVNVENPHDAMRSLSQVIDYFIRTSGGREHTRPMETNDLSLLGLHNPDYDRTIQLDFPFLDDEPEHDYEEATSPARSPPNSPTKSPFLQSKSLGQADSRNIVGILKPPQSGNSGKTVGFNPNVHHTVAASRYTRQKDIPTMDELVNRHQEAAELWNLDNIIGGFETDHLYINEEELNKLHKADQPRQRQGRDHSPPPPPLPQPHRIAPKKASYANIQDADQMESFTVINSLPVAPPVPRDPLPFTAIPPLPAKKPHRVESNTASKSLSTSPTSPVSTNQPTSHTKLHASHSFSPNTSNRPVASVQPTTPASQGSQFRKSLSEEQFKQPSQQIGSPSSFPSWRDNLKPLKQIQKLDNTKDTPDVDTSEPKSGIDIGNPGGVNTLRSRFERVSTGDTAAVLRNASNFDEGYSEGLNPDFKNKLEGLIGGVTSGPAGVGPKSPTGSRPTSGTVTEDHIYAELPPIEPDEVFYMNTKYNKDT